MSFADELRKPVEKKHDYGWENDLAKDCIGAIQKECLRKKQQGKRQISGEFYYDGADYGTYLICEGPFGTRLSINTDLEYLRRRVEQGVRELGFTDYKISITERDEMRTYYTIFHNEKQKPTGKKEHYLTVDIRW